MQTFIRRGSMVVLAALFAASATLMGQTVVTRLATLMVAGTTTSGGVVSVTGSTGLPDTAVGFQFASFASPNIGRIFIGDGTGYRMHISTRTGGVTTDRFTFFDNGNLTVAGASVLNGAVTTNATLAVGGNASVAGALGAGATSLASLAVAGNSTFGGTVAVTGAFSAPIVYATNGMLANDGTATVPTYTFFGNSSTGFYRDASSGRIGWALAGVHGGYLGAGQFEAAQNLGVAGGALGTGSIPGGVLSVGRNSSGSGAAGCIILLDRGGSFLYLYNGGSHLLRYNISSEGCPTENGSQPHSGSVIGDQTSTAESKHLLGTASNRDMLEAVLRTRVHRFTYRDGRYDGEIFTGIVTDESPWFGKDRDASHPQGKALNEINGLGYTVGAIQAMHAELNAVRAELASVRAEVTRLKRRR